MSGEPIRPLTKPMALRKRLTSLNAAAAGARPNYGSSQCAGSCTLHSTRHPCSSANGFSSSIQTRSHSGPSRWVSSQPGKSSRGEPIFNRSAGKVPLSHGYRCVGKFKVQSLSLQRTRFYGNTEHGAYMCESDTSAEGMRAAKNETHP